MKNMNQQVEENKQQRMKGENNGNEEPVEEKSDKINSQSGDIKDKKEPAANTPLPEPCETERKIPGLHNDL